MVRKVLFQGNNRGSIPRTATSILIMPLRLRQRSATLVMSRAGCISLKRLHFGPVAQLGERRLCKADVAGSIPVGSTSFGAFA